MFMLMTVACEKLLCLTAICEEILRQKFPSPEVDIEKKKGTEKNRSRLKSDRKPSVPRVG